MTIGFGKKINVFDPSIVIIEYNARLGKEKPYVVPYEEKFTRNEKHYSMIYYGASINALVKLGIKKGYAFVCCNKAGNNAFFVKKELLNDRVKEQSIEKGFYEINLEKLEIKMAISHTVMKKKRQI